MNMKEFGWWLLVVGLSLQIADVATDGQIFGSGGPLERLNTSVPKFPLPWPSGVETNVAFLLIAAGGLLYYGG